jgi:alanyl-tRNA synthetase
MRAAVSERYSSEEIRDLFLGFFERHDHQRIAGASLIPASDPTLLFVNAGMAPLKPYFTGQERPPYPRLCNIQPCLRTIDIDEVGDRHHLTMFEMLGSWSIGDYFKQRAIELAHELLTGVLGLDPARLYATVFAGDRARDLAPDEDSAAFWEAAGVPRDHIVALGFEDNFWGPAGDTGPCGPCTEVFWDTGDEYGPAYLPGGEFDTTRRYIEIWNAGVFMLYDQQRDGRLAPLPFTSVDTGSGLERLTMTLNGQRTVYDTDLLAPVLGVVQQVLGETGEVLPRHRVITDHLRSAVFVLAEGVRPSNEGRGYIPRRLIRRSLTVARRSGVPEPDLAAVAEAVIGRLGPHYPRLAERRDEVLSLLEDERRDFGRAARRGLDHLEGLLASGRAVSGSDAFRLFATYGLPVEVTRELAA